MVISPDTTIDLYSGVDIGTEQQLAFSSRLKQTAYFTSKRLKRQYPCTVVKNKIGQIKVAIKPRSQATAQDLTGEDLTTCNYLSFINPSFDNKVIYCHIIDYEYLNNETAILYYTIDYWQTWMFDVTFHDMYIDREHVSQDEWNKLEINPYRADVPQMVTAEPLPTPKEYEKPFYDISWGEGDNFELRDGSGMLTRDNTTADWSRMIKGSWAYWNVMLILAPTDWRNFAASLADYEEHEYDGGVFNYGDYCKVPSTDPDAVNGYMFYQCTSQTGTSGPFDPTKWVAINSMIAQPTGGSDHVTVPASDFGVSKSNELWLNTDPNSGHTFYPGDPEGSPVAWYFERKICVTYESSQVEREYYNILAKYNVKYSEAGDTRLIDGRYTWSAKPKGCHVLFIETAECWKELASFLNRYNAISQIVGIFGMPAKVVNMSTLKASASAGYLGGLASDDIYNVPTSYRKTGNAFDGHSGKQKVVRNHKLYTSPFSYIRIVAPSGSTKEYSYENFNSVVNTSPTFCSFRILCDAAGDSPKIYLVPYGYNSSYHLSDSVVSALNNLGELGSNIGDKMATAMAYNLDEAMCIEGFPELSFNTDGYITFLASQYAGARSGLSLETANAINAGELATNGPLTAINAIADVAGSAMGAVIGSAGKVGGGSGGGNFWSTPMGAGGGALASSMGNIINTGYSRANLQSTKELISESGQWMNGTLIPNDDAYINRFAPAKPAYANNAYTGGTGGVIHYLRGFAPFDLVAINVQLRDDILDYYDKWFDMYGYTSGRCGMPHVIDFVRGETANTKVPHWVTLNGHPTTYIKTSDAKVEHAMLPVAQNIAAMFNAGVRMMKGDLT